MQPEDKPTVIYDGDCALCNTAVKFLKTEKTPEGFRFIPSSDPLTASLLNKYQIPEETTGNTVIFIDKNRIYTKSTAIIKALQHKGSFWRLAGVFYIIPMVLRDKIYDWFSRRRKLPIF